MRRAIETDLIHWKNSPIRKPLLVRGARQVGKSYTIEYFGKHHFKSFVQVNFELNPAFKNCFVSLEPDKIIQLIELMTLQPIIAGETLLFLDEIQECPDAILSLRYFKEIMPALHVIGAGSLLEFALNAPEFKAPVGRIESLYMKPCSFLEFLRADGHEKLIDYLSHVSFSSPIELPVHDRLLEKIREYFVVGGMPEALAYYIETRNLLSLDKLHASLMESYQKDFGKYDEKVKSKLIQKVFDKAPTLIGGKIKYVNIDEHLQARELKPALEALYDAGLLHPIYHTSAAGIPLNMGVNEKAFKLLFLDIGLVKYACRVDGASLLQDQLILINRGAMAEQFVGQELLAYEKNYQKAQLYFWEREKTNSQAEVDYIMQYHNHIVPIEVKAGKTGRLKSLQLFLNEKNRDLGVRISQNEFSLTNRVLSIPLYMIHELPRLLELSQQQNKAPPNTD